MLAGGEEYPLRDAGERAGGGTQQLRVADLRAEGGVHERAVDARCGLEPEAANVRIALVERARRAREHRAEAMRTEVVERRGGDRPQRAVGVRRRAEMDADVDERDVEALGDHARRELARLAHDHLGTPALDQGVQRGQRGPRVEADEQLLDDMHRARRGVREHRRPRGDPVARLSHAGEHEPAPLDHALRRGRRGDHHLVPGAFASTGEGHQRPEVPAALPACEQNAHMRFRRPRGRSYS